MPDHRFVRRKTWNLCLFISLMSFIAVACGEKQEDKQIEKPLVYEGMPGSELKSVLGDPQSVASGGEVYDANTATTKKVEKWIYDKRTVVLIDDTVKSPNLQIEP